MKVLKLVTIAAALLASGVAMADEAVVNQGKVFDANQLIPTGARLEVGTTGYGGALLWTANPYVGLALGYNGGDISWSGDLKLNGTTYDTKMKNKLGYLNAEIRPWGTSSNRWVQGLYGAAGVGYVDTEYQLKRNVGGSRNFTVGNTDFQSGADGFAMRGKASYDNDIAPYVGIGWAPKITKNIGVFGEVGAYYTGNPTAEIHAVSGTAINTSGVNVNDAIAKEQRDLENKSKYEWLPVGKVGVSYNW